MPVPRNRGRQAWRHSLPILCREKDTVYVWRHSAGYVIPEPMNVTKRDSTLPLTPQLLQILVALSAGRSTGYDVMRRVKEDTHGEMTLRQSTVYPALTRLRKLYCVNEDGNENFRMYELTEVGAQVLEWELERVEAVAKLGRGRLSDRQLRARSADF